MEIDGSIDSIVESVEQSTNNEIPMESFQAEAPQPIEQAPQEYEFQSDGRQVKAPIDKILKWASMGYTAPNRIGELSRKLSDYESRSKQYETYEKTYKPIDEWAQKNPDKWQSLFQSWQQAQYGAQGQAPQQGAPDAGYKLPPEVIQKLQSHDQFIEQQQQKEVVLRERQADQSLGGEIESIRKQYSNLDFDAPDANGNSLEYQILEHATKNHIPSFRAAFRDYCFDQLNQSSSAKARASAQLSPKTRSGLLGKDSAPSSSRGQVPNLRGVNYDQIHEMILSEMGLSN